jgi:hypothetical protein
MPWQKPPKFTTLSSACDFLFDKMMQEPALVQIMSFIKSKVPLEAIAKILIFSGFQGGMWTPDLGLLMCKPVLYMLAGIAHRSGAPDAQLTNIDRSGIKGLVHMKTIQMTTSNPMAQAKNPAPAQEPAGLQKVKSFGQGLLAPQQGA